MSKVIKAYYEITKPERTLANVVTGLAGYLFASRWHIDWPSFVSFMAGMTLIIASACVLNNFTDRDLDKVMHRTKRRVLVTGELSAQNAAIFGLVIGVIGFWLLAHTNALTFLIGFIAYVSYVVFYDLAKRYSEWGTLVGTVPGAASLVAGYTAVTGHLDIAAALLFVIMVCWQMAHFYAIAIYRLKDYKKANVPVWPAKYGVQSTKRQIYVFVAAFITANALLWATHYVGYIYLIVVCVSGAYWLLLAARGFEKKTNDDTWARGLFKFSLVILLIFAAMLTIGPILA